MNYYSVEVEVGNCEYYKFDGMCLVEEVSVEFVECLG